LLSSNRWVLSFWPNAVKIRKQEKIKFEKKRNILEKIAYKIQYSHMRSKMTREVVTPTRALFHPQDWSKTVTSRLAS
jgi:hypothetical protein